MAPKRDASGHSKKRFDHDTTDIRDLRQRVVAYYATGLNETALRWTRDQDSLRAHVRDVIAKSNFERFKRPLVVRHLTRLFWLFRVCSTEELTSCATEKERVELVHIIAGGPLALNGLNACTLIMLRELESMTHFRALKSAFSILGREYSNAKAFDAASKQVDVGLRSTVTVDSWCNPLASKDMKVSVSDYFKKRRDNSRLQAVPGVNMIVYHLVYIVHSMLVTLLRRNNLKGAQALRESPSVVREKRRDNAFPNTFIGTACESLVLALGLSRVSRGIEMCHLRFDDLTFESGRPLALAGLDPTVLVGETRYIEKAWKAKKVDTMYVLSHHILPSYMHMLSVPHLLAAVVGTILVLDIDRFDPRLNPSMNIFTTRTHGDSCVLRPATTQDLSKRLIRNHPATADSPVGGFHYHGFSIYGTRYLLAAELVTFGLMDCDSRIRDMLLMYFGHSSMSDLITTTYAMNLFRGKASNRVVTVSRDDDDSDGGGDDDDEVQQDERTHTMFILCQSMTSNKAWEMGRELSHLIISKLQGLHVDLSDVANRH